MSFNVVTKLKFLSKGLLNKNFLKIPKKQKSKQKITSLTCLFCLSIPSSFVLMALGDAVYHGAFLANVNGVLCRWLGSRLLTSGMPSILGCHGNSA